MIQEKGVNRARRMLSRSRGKGNRENKNSGRRQRWRGWKEKGWRGKEKWR
jgi:hypothetical protein